MYTHLHCSIVLCFSPIFFLLKLENYITVLFIHLFTFLFIHLSIYLLIHLLIYSFVCLHGKCLFFHLEYYIDSSVFINMLKRKQFFLQVFFSVRATVRHDQ